MSERSSSVAKSGLQATYNDLLALQDQTDQVPLTTALDAVGAALRALDGAATTPVPTEVADLRRYVIELREWKAAILDKCKASNGFEQLEWGGDKEGWGFVHYFIGHLETRALHAETVLAEQDARPLAQPSLDHAKDYVDRAIASYVGDPADNQFQKGYLAALEVVRDEAFTIPRPHRETT